MSLRPCTSLRFSGGATIGFGLPDDDLASLSTRFDFALDGPTDRQPAMTYRVGSHADGPPAYERHDPLRDLPVESLGSDLDGLVDDLHLSVALHATEEVFVHAGVVVWNGTAIVIPGRSHAGKSTLVDALVRAGATYCSDEYARITGDGSIAPYARPIHLRAATGRRLVDPRSIGTVATAPHRPGLIVFTHHDEAATFDPQPVAPAQAALDLFDNVVIAQVDPPRAMAAVATVARLATAVRGPRPDARAVASTILQLADRMEVV